MKQEELETEIMDNIVYGDIKENEWEISEPYYELDDQCCNQIEFEPKKPTSIEQIESFKISMEVSGTVTYTYKRKK